VVPLQQDVVVAVHAMVLYQLVGVLLALGLIVLIVILEVALDCCHVPVDGPEASQLLEKLLFASNRGWRRAISLLM
jgi:hypothetical protein